VVSHYNVMPVDGYLRRRGQPRPRRRFERHPAARRKSKKDLPRGSSIIVRGQAETMRSSYLGLGVGLVGRLC
jgi:hypothetical protein